MSVGKPGYGSVCTSTAPGRLMALDGHAVGEHVDDAAGLLELDEHEVEVRGIEAAHGDRATGQCAGDDEGAGLDAVAHDAVLDGVKRLNALDGERGGPAARDTRAHAVEEVDEIDDLRFAGRVLDDASVPLATTAAMSRFSVAPTLGKSSVTCAACSPSAGAIASMKPWPVRISTPSSVSPLMCMSILREPMLQPARHRDASLAVTRHERAEHGDRRAHLRDHLVGRLEARQAWSRRPSASGPNGSPSRRDPRAPPT